MNKSELVGLACLSISYNCGVRERCPMFHGMDDERSFI